MFKKVQLRFFGIIIAILLAVFIAILGSINLIMNAVMERQSRNVLKQIAAGVEYDDVTSTFTFVRDDFFSDEHKNDIPPPKPEWNTEERQGVSSAETTEAEIVQTETVSEEQEVFYNNGNTDNNIESQTEVNHEIPSEIKTEEAEKTTQPSSDVQSEKPVETEAVQTKPAETKPVEIRTTVFKPIETKPAENEKPNGNNDKPDNQKPQENKPHDNWWENNPWNNNDNHNNEWENPKPNDDFQWWYPWWNIEEQWKPENDIEQTAFSVDEGFSGIIQLSAMDETEIPKNEFRPDFERMRMDREPVPKSLGSIDFFIVMADENGNYLATLNNDELSEENAQLYISAIDERGLIGGMVNNYQFYSAEKANGKLYVFTDKTAELDMLKKLRRTTFLIGIISIIVISVAAYFLSGLIVKPIKEAFEKQKQFISDASHELKTPLTVISANADVLSGEIGGNKWLNYIQDQTTKMNVLVNELLNLTRLENNTSNFIRTEFDLSKAIENTALPFECQAFEMDRKFVLKIDENIKITASEQHIKQMAAIFIDNAIKYSNEGGTVRVSLRKEGDKKILSVYNTGNGIKESEKSMIFERFYRSDESRNRDSGSYGLGLAIAKSIIDKHKYRISIDNEEGNYICFNIIMQ